MATVRVRIAILTVRITLSVCPFNRMAHTANIRASQSLMQGQRLHQQKTSALGHRLSSIETKLDTILQHLKTPPHLSSSDQSPFSHEDDVKLVGVPVSPC
jgi:hypothetical protein